MSHNYLAPCLSVYCGILCNALAGGRARAFKLNLNGARPHGTIQQQQQQLSQMPAEIPFCARKA